MLDLKSNSLPTNTSGKLGACVSAVAFTLLFTVSTIALTALFISIEDEFYGKTENVQDSKDVFLKKAQGQQEGALLYVTKNRSDSAKARALEQPNSSMKMKRQRVRENFDSDAGNDEMYDSVIEIALIILSATVIVVFLVIIIFSTHDNQWSVPSLSTVSKGPCPNCKKFVRPKMEQAHRVSLTSLNQKSVLSMSNDIFNFNSLWTSGRAKNTDEAEGRKPRFWSVLFYNSQKVCPSTMV